MASEGGGATEDEGAKRDEHGKKPSSAEPGGDEPARDETCPPVDLDSARDRAG